MVPEISLPYSQLPNCYIVVKEVQQDATVAFLFAMTLLYMFRVTISPIIRSTMLNMATGELAHLGCY